MTKNLEKYIGLTRAAGGVTTGFDSVMAEIRGGRSKIVLIASDASDRTKKQLTDKCKFYSVKHRIIDTDSIALGKLIGKPASAAISLNGKGCTKQVIEEAEKCFT